MKKNKTLIKELLAELHYQQERVRIDLRSARAGMETCRKIGARMRKLQNEKRKP